MTARFARKNHGTGHSYTLDGEKVPGVTSVVKLFNTGEGLIRWAARKAGEVVVDEWDELLAMKPTERGDYVTRAFERERTSKATRGKRVHAMAERVAGGAPLAEVPPELQSRVQGIADFLDAWDLEPLVSESPVCSTEYRYAGTLDAIMTSPKLGTVLVDYKNKDDGRSPYPETALQLAAYRYCDVRLEEVEQPPGPRGGARKPLLVEKPMIPVDSCAVIGVTDDTSTLWPIDADARIHTVFLHLLELHYEWERRVGWKFKDSAEFSPVVGEPLWPESVAS